MVELADDLAVDRVMAGDLVPVDHVHVVSKRLMQQGQLAWIVLSIAIRVEDEVLRRVGETAPEGPAITPVGFMRDDLEVGESRLKLRKDGAAVVRAGIVDDDDFVVVRKLAKSDVRDDHHRGNSAAIVVGGEES